MKIIRQSVVLRAGAGELYAMYLSPRRHAAITGRPVKIGAKPGAKFRAFNGADSALHAERETRPRRTHARQRARA
jgi:hypothetical protein